MKETKDVKHKKMLHVHRQEDSIRPNSQPDLQTQRSCSRAVTDSTAYGEESAREPTVLKGTNGGDSLTSSLAVKPQTPRQHYWRKDGQLGNERESSPEADLRQDGQLTKKNQRFSGARTVLLVLFCFG